ncbi:MAG TPA: NUDIX domain-containing protein [Acidimicrobiales bacterium]|nr:NUDIX domain-containing protein [Acidimicrobiales bacterium]
MPLVAHPPGPPPRSAPGPADLAAARDHIQAARPGDASHEAHRAGMLAFLAAHPGALDRTCADGHLTGSAMVVDPESRRFLLMLHAKLGRWFQPGGHADGDGDLPTVAWKEATEETGIAGLSLVTPAVDLDIHHVAPPHGPHLHLDVRYLALAPPGAAPARNHEALDLRWATYDELPGYGVDDGLLRLARAARASLDEVI